jgi:hypothetical protein
MRDLDQNCRATFCCSFQRRVQQQKKKFERAAQTAKCGSVVLIQITHCISGANAANAHVCGPTPLKKLNALRSIA